MTFFRKLFAALLAMISVPALAQFTTDVSGGGAGGTRMVIRQDGPGKATLSLIGVKVVYLNHDPKIKDLKPKTDVSGKGQVWIVDPEVTNLGGAEICLSGVGRGGWAVASGKVDKTKVACAPLSNSIQLPVAINSNGGNTCVGLTWLVVQGDSVVKDAWASHPDGATNIMAKRASGANDMATVLCVDSAGNIAPPTPDQVTAYSAWYTKVTANN
jgi:hypothetical protein